MSPTTYFVEATTRRVVGKNSDGSPTITELIDLAPVVDPKNPAPFAFSSAGGKVSLSITDPKNQGLLIEGLNYTLTFAPAITATAAPTSVKDAFTVSPPPANEPTL